jgi:hypothetical protein
VLGSGVETIQRHLRYVAAPGSIHHTGAIYQLYHETLGPQCHSFVLPPPDDPALVLLPERWLEALYRRPRRPGTSVDIEDITAVASEWVFDEHPEMLDATVRTVRGATGEGATRNATHRALWIAARKARAGCYPFSRAVAEIEVAAAAAYAERGMELGLDDFARSIKHAVADALNMSDAEVKAWGEWGDLDPQAVSSRPQKPKIPNKSREPLSQRRSQDRLQLRALAHLRPFLPCRVIGIQARCGWPTGWRNNTTAS